MPTAAHFIVKDHPDPSRSSRFILEEMEYTVFRRSMREALQVFRVRTLMCSSAIMAFLTETSVPPLLRLARQPP